MTEFYPVLSVVLSLCFIWLGMRIEELHRRLRALSAENDYLRKVISHQAPSPSQAYIPIYTLIDLSMYSPSPSAAAEEGDDEPA